MEDLYNIINIDPFNVLYKEGKLGDVKGDIIDDTG